MDFQKKFVCPICELAIEIPNDTVGAKYVCPYCGRRLVVSNRRDNGKVCLFDDESESAMIIAYMFIDIDNPNPGHAPIFPTHNVAYLYATRFWNGRLRNGRYKIIEWTVGQNRNIDYFQTDGFRYSPEAELKRACREMLDFYDQPAFTTYSYW